MTSGELMQRMGALRQLRCTCKCHSSSKSAGARAFRHHAGQRRPAKSESPETYDWRSELQAHDKPFLDHVTLVVRGGGGAPGLARFGGTGGDGGNVFLRAAEGVKLTALMPQKGEHVTRVRAGEGHASSKLYIRGEDGRDVTVKVPVGVSVCNEGSRPLVDLNQPGDTVQVAKGGKGGDASNDYKSRKGTSATLKLYLKLIADVGLVGFPNAGKSTLLARLSAAKPAITPFPFTTLHPNVGTVVYKDHRQISLADTPGLIEGASRNIGLGHRFLRHIERTKLLAYVIDINGFRLNQNSPQRSGYETLLLLMKELQLYDSSLVHKPCMLLINKVENRKLIQSSQELQLRLKEREIPESLKEFEPFTFPEFSHVMDISAKLAVGMEKLTEAFRSELDILAETETELVKPDERRERIAMDLMHDVRGR